MSVSSFTFNSTRHSPRQLLPVFFFFCSSRITTTTMITTTTTTITTHTAALPELQPESLVRVLGNPSQSVISSSPQPPPPRLPSFQINRHSVLGASVTISRGLSPSSFVHLMSLCITDPHQNYFSP